MADEAINATKRPKGRSPLYPSINLETAIQRARQLHDKERRHATPVATIASHGNYKSLNGPAAQALAALKKYGLTEEEGTGDDRKARLSTLADVILVHPDEALRRNAIQEAALKPAMHRELWEKYKQDLPSDSNLHWELTHDRGFTETGASEFIPVYRATVAFAQLASHVPDPLDDPDEQEDAERQDHQTGDDDSRTYLQSGRKAHDKRTTTKSWAIPLIDSAAITIEGAFPITERDWQQFKVVLEVMKPALVRDESAIADAP
jgi:hypothetical protein